MSAGSKPPDDRIPRKCGLDCKQVKDAKDFHCPKLAHCNWCNACYRERQKQK